MSLTDQAFIKAYGKGTDDTSASPRPMRALRMSSHPTPLSLQRGSSTNLDEAYDAGAWYRPDTEAPTERLRDTGLARSEAARVGPSPARHSTDTLAPDVVLRIDAAKHGDIPAPRNTAAVFSAIEAEVAEAPRAPSHDDTLHLPSPGDALRLPSQGKGRTARTARTEPFVAAWEVDELRWPASCLRLWQASQHDIAQAGEKLLSAARRGRKIVVITGLMRGEGRSTLAICLARWASTAGASTALVDADTANSSLSDKLALDSPHGWIDVAANRIPLAEAAITLRGSGLTIFPCVSTDPSSHAGQATLAPSSEAEHLAATRPSDIQHASVLPALLVELSSAFELVLVDGGPLGDEMFTKSGVATAADVALVVHDVRRKSQADVDRALAQLQASGVHALAIAQNFAPIASRQNAERSSTLC